MKDNNKETNDILKKILSQQEQILTRLDNLENRDERKVIEKTISNTMNKIQDKTSTNILERVINTKSFDELAKVFETYDLFNYKRFESIQKQIKECENIAQLERINQWRYDLQNSSFNRDKFPFTRTLRSSFLSLVINKPLKEIMPKHSNKELLEYYLRDVAYSDTFRDILIKGLKENKSYEKELFNKFVYLDLGKSKNEEIENILFYNPVLINKYQDRELTSFKKTNFNPFITAVSVFLFPVMLGLMMAVLKDGKKKYQLSKHNFGVGKALKLYLSVFCQATIPFEIDWDWSNKNNKIEHQRNLLPHLDE